MLLSWFELLQLDLHLDLLQVSLFKQLCQFLDLFLACQQAGFFTPCVHIMWLVQLAIVWACTTDVTRVHQA